MKCNSVLVSSGLFHHQIHGMKKKNLADGTDSFPWHLPIRNRGFVIGNGCPIFGPYKCHQPSVRIRGLCISIPPIKNANW